MNQNEVNKKLRNITQDWITSEPVKKLLKSGEGNFSDVFVPGITEHYAEAEGRRFLLFGQEARNFNFGNDNSVENIQEWVIRYTLRQVYQNYSEKSEEKWNNSPFWSLFRKIEENGWHPVWSNLDKFHKFDLESKKTIPLTSGEEVAFNSSKMKDGKTIVQEEIDVLKPDIIVFLVGPYYMKSLSTALEIKKDQLSAFKPSTNAEGYCVQIEETLTKLSVPVYWTYHPAYIIRSESRGMSLDGLIGHMIRTAENSQIL